MSLDELEKLNLTIRMAAFRWRRANILYHKVCVYMQPLPQGNAP